MGGVARRVQSDVRLEGPASALELFAYPDSAHASSRMGLVHEGSTTTVGDEVVRRQPMNGERSGSGSRRRVAISPSEPFLRSMDGDPPLG